MEFFGTPVFSRAVNFREYSKFIKEELDMLALAGTIQGNTVIIENDNITSYIYYLEKNLQYSDKVKKFFRESYNSGK